MIKGRNGTWKRYDARLSLGLSEAQRSPKRLEEASQSPKLLFPVSESSVMASDSDCRLPAAALPPAPAIGLIYDLRQKAHMKKRTLLDSRRMLNVLSPVIGPFFKTVLVENEGI